MKITPNTVVSKSQFALVVVLCLPTGTAATAAAAAVVTIVKALFSVAVVY